MDRSVPFLLALLALLASCLGAFAQQPSDGGTYNAGFGDLSDEEGVDPLHRAAHLGDHEEVDKLLRRPGQNVNSLNNNRTPLLRAAYNGHAKVVAQLLAHDDVKVTATNEHGYNALHSACWKGHVNVVELLLKDGRIDPAASTVAPNLILGEGNSGGQHVGGRQGATKDTIVRDGLTPLIIACDEGHDKIVRMLIRDGRSDVEEVYHGSSPIHVAARNGHRDVVKTLLDVGVDVNVADSHNRTPLWWAASSGSVAVTKELLSRPNVDLKKASDEGSPLSMANWNSHEAIVHMILKAHGIQVKTKETDKLALFELFSSWDVNGDQTLSRAELQGPLLAAEMDTDITLRMFDRDATPGLSEGELEELVTDHSTSHKHHEFSLGFLLEPRHDDADFEDKTARTFQDVVELLKQKVKEVPPPNEL